MIENKYEERQVTQRVLIDHTYVCDVCGRKMKIPQHYWHITLENVNDYDGCEVSKEYDCCSLICVNEIYDKFFKDCQFNLHNQDNLIITHKHTISAEETTINTNYMIDQLFYNN